MQQKNKALIGGSLILGGLGLLYFLKLKITREGNVLTVKRGNAIAIAQLNPYWLVEKQGNIDLIDYDKDKHTIKIARFDDKNISVSRWYDVQLVDTDTGKVLSQLPDIIIPFQT